MPPISTSRRRGAQPGNCNTLTQLPTYPAAHIRFDSNLERIKKKTQEVADAFFILPPSSDLLHPIAG
jgi:hypothetical protein